MKLKLLILFFLIVHSCAGQDSLKTYTEEYSSKSLLRKANQENKRKNAKLASTQTSKIQTKDKKEPLIFPFLYVLATLILILIIKRLMDKNPPKKPYSYFQND